MVDNIHVEGNPVSGISSMKADNVESVKYYDLTGCELKTPAKGAVVVMKTVMTNGKTDVMKIIF